MDFSEKELKILEILLKRPGESGFSDILRFSPFSREPTFRYLQSLLKQNLIKKRRIANIFLYSINYQEPKVPPILSYIMNKTMSKKDREIGDRLRGTNALFAIKGEDLLIVSNSHNLNAKTMSLKEFRERAAMRGFVEDILRAYRPVFNIERFYSEISEFL